MNKTMEVSGAMSAIKATAKADVDGTGYETSNKVSTPMNFSAAFRIYDNLYAGVTLYTPYGSSINWGKSWPGAVLNQSCDLKVFTVQPTVSWRILPKLSVGAGLMISWGSVDLKKGLVPTSSMDKLVNLQYEAAMLQYKAAQLAAMIPGSPAPGEAPVKTGYTYGNMPPASVGLKGNSELALGFNIGAMYDITDKWTVGASFRSKMEMKVKAGDASVEYADEMARATLGSTLDNLNYANFSAQMPCPYVLTAGVAYKPIERLTLAFDAQLNGWGTYKNLDIEFAGLEAYNQHLEKNYKNAMTYHLGGQFAMTERLDLRAGLMVDCSPCNNELYNPETPGTTKIEPSVGLSFRPLKGLSIDVAFMYVHGIKVENASCALRRPPRTRIQCRTCTIRRRNSPIQCRSSTNRAAYRDADSPLPTSRHHRAARASDLYSRLHGACLYPGNRHQLLILIRRPDRIGNPEAAPSKTEHEI